MTYTITGKVSMFGGPDDHGVRPDEGLALYDKSDIRFPGRRFRPERNPHDLFLPYQPRGTTGMARRLDPTQFYIATRWNYKVTPRDFLRQIQITVIARKTNRSFLAWPADWGPNIDTGREADLSPGLIKALGIETDDLIEVIVPTPKGVEMYV
jgi:hypothetical protein